MRAPIVWIAEDSGFEDSGEFFHSGRFSAHLDEGKDPTEWLNGVSVEEAIAWGRARAARVFIRTGDSDYYSAGTEHPADKPLWPPPDLPELVRRRPAEERWKDRTDDDAPIDWRVSVYLSRAELASTWKQDWDADIAALAGAIGAASWDRDLLDRFDHERAEAARKVEPGQPYGWVSTAPAAWRVVLIEPAPTAARAIELAQPRIGAPKGWEISIDAEPA